MGEQSLREVPVGVLPLERLAQVVRPDRAELFADYAARAQQLLGDRVVWNVSATASGGGVAEMLMALLSYGRAAGVDTRWLVLDGGQEFFRITKRMHNFLHGSVGDAGRLDDPERRVYEAVLANQLSLLSERVRPGDLVLLHDPQTAGLVPGIRDLGAHAIWRSHGGADVGNRATADAWSFLRPYVEKADAVIFTRAEYAPAWLDRSRGFVIPPSLDPFSPKNCDLTDAQVAATLRAAGIVAGNVGDRYRDFTRRDGSTGHMRSHSGVIMGGEMLSAGARYVLQVSRWDRLKDMAGVLTGFVSALSSLPDDVDLVLAGPRPEAVTEDPEGPQVAAECLAAWHRLPATVRRRIHLCSLPVDDPDENAHLVNALQRRAELVVQKSLAEGFGLTVTESMWKGRAVLATRVGGIQDQVIDDENGLLLDDPRDLGAFSDAVGLVMADPGLREELGAAAHERVRDQFLGDRHLGQYLELFAALLD